MIELQKQRLRGTRCVGITFYGLVLEGTELLRAKPSTDNWTVITPTLS